MKALPFSIMEVLLKKAGAKRASLGAKDELKKSLEKKAHEISKKALSLSGHAGRKTVKKKDIELVLGEL
jgi:histone H3/H4